jgi:hypothetical protein
LNHDCFGRDDRSSNHQHPCLLMAYRKENATLPVAGKDHLMITHHVCLRHGATPDAEIILRSPTMSAYDMVQLHNLGHVWHGDVPLLIILFRNTCPSPFRLVLADLDAGPSVQVHVPVSVDPAYVTHPLPLSRARAPPLTHRPACARLNTISGVHFQNINGQILMLKVETHTGVEACYLWTLWTSASKTIHSTPPLRPNNR